MLPLFEEGHMSASSLQRDGRVRMAKRGLRSEPVATRKRRRLAVAAVTSSSTSTYGGVVAFKHAWKEFLKDGWTSQPPPRQSLDDRYRHIRPEGDPAGKEGLDFLLWEAAVMRFVKGEEFRICNAERGLTYTLTSAPTAVPTLVTAGTAGTVEVVVVTTLVVTVALVVVGEAMLVEITATSVSKLDVGRGEIRRGEAEDESDRATAGGVSGTA
ncbi:hypothetical protein JG688_00014333 [Phytophthora aleatoria]|uniref:Uncharacterized protein n=1 Tax=Phytophthora aleatoria TaxID=2496075 RepID=A0A8J5IK68_9STRA|nr:hypothetical protein JG688_00014333 [Phytophthora aleatoria]